MDAFVSEETNFMLKPLAHAKEAFEKLAGCRIYRHSLPHGADLFFDLDRRFGLEHFEVVFDVGANIGQTALVYLDQFPNAQIYSFEPVPETYQKLRSTTEGRSRLHAFNVGMGRERGQATIMIYPDNDQLSSIVLNRPDRHGKHSASITLETIASFADGKGLERIDLLKIDTEGYDLEVLSGAESWLKSQRVLSVLTECEPVPRTGNFIALHETAALMRDSGYELLGLYDQCDYGNALLYCNALFVCKEFTQARRAHPRPGLILNSDVSH